MEISYFFCVSSFQHPVDICINMWKFLFAEENIKINPDSATLYWGKDSIILLENAILLEMITVDNTIHSYVLLHMIGMMRSHKYSMDISSYEYGGPPQ